jgi:arylsulfatase A-like enzyme
MTRHARLLAGLLALGATAFLHGAERRPNIVLIVADDLGWGDLGCYPQDPRWGEEASTPTPRLDALAADGVRFTQAYATGMVCAPSRAGLLTGQHQQRFGYYGFEESLAPIPTRLKLLPEALREAGYRTGMVGKWHFSSAKGSWPIDRGFDRFFGFIGGQHDYYQPSVGETMLGAGRANDAFIYDQSEPVSEIGFLTDDLTNRAIEFVSEPGEAPFFLYLAYNAPHPPMQAPWSDLEKYASLRPDGAFTPRDIARAMIENLDRNVGRLLDSLEESGRGRDTFVVFTSDNGGSDGGPGRVLQHNGGLKGRKSTFYEGGIRVPMIVRWPAGIRQGNTYEKTVSQLDLYPTFLALADHGAIKTQALDGVDLRPYLAGERSEVPQPRLFWCVENTAAWAVREEDWKLVREDTDPTTLSGAFRGDAPRRFALQLYNLATDPCETTDLLSTEPEVAARLEASMKDFRASLAPSLATPDVLAGWKATLARRAETPELDKARSPSGSPGHWKGGEKRNRIQ